MKSRDIEVPYVNTKINIADIQTKSVTTQTTTYMLENECGYDTEWLHKLKAETDSVCTPINPKARCAAVAAMAFCRHASTYYEIDDTGQRVLNSAFGEIVPRSDSRFADARVMHAMRYGQTMRMQYPDCSGR